MTSWYVTVAVTKRIKGVSLYEVAGKIKYPYIDHKSFGEIVAIYRESDEYSTWTVRADVTMKVEADDFEEIKRVFHNPNKLFPFVFQGFVKFEKAEEVPVGEWQEYV